MGGTFAHSGPGLNPEALTWPLTTSRLKSGGFNSRFSCLWRNPEFISSSIYCRMAFTLWGMVLLQLRFCLKRFRHNCTGLKHSKLTALSLEQLGLSPVWGALCGIRTLCGFLVPFLPDWWVKHKMHQIYTWNYIGHSQDSYQVTWKSIHQKYFPKMYTKQQKHKLNDGALWGIRHFVAECQSRNVNCYCC